MDKLFKDLIDKKVLYFVWKDTNKINNFFDGNSELDLLINYNQKFLFESIISKYGYIFLNVVKSLKRGKINHYIKYHNGKYYHLHVYYDLITGNHFVKEYNFNLDNSIFQNYELNNDIKVIDKEGELVFLAIRLLIKNTILFKRVKQSEINRLINLSSDYNIKKTQIFLEKILPNAKFTIQEFIKESLSPTTTLFKRSAIKKQIDIYKEKNSLAFLFSYLNIRLNLLRLRLQRRSNKTLSKEGVTFAIIGTDGSGKTTITNRLLKLYSSKTSCKKFYLGGNLKTYSILTRIYYFNYYFTRVFSPLKNKNRVAWTLYYNAVTLLELGKAKDRRRKVKNANKLKNKGWIVIYERFPIVNLFDFPNNLNKLKTHKFYRKNNIVDKRIEKINNVVNMITPPDVSLLIITDLENMLKRRQLALNEIKDINKKLNTQKEFLENYDNDLIVISNNSNIESSINEAINHVNKALCMSSL